MEQLLQNEIKRKPPGIINKTIWWLWVILLCCLLILCLYFEAPSKVIALIIIFLAAATILPRIYRKWFWLGVGIVVLALIVWVFLPEDNEGWRPYTFDKELTELQAKYAVPDSENAAVIYNQIFKNWKQKEANEPNLPDCWFDNVRKDPWLSKDQPEIAAYLWYHRNTIDGVLQAAKLEKCSFPITNDLLFFDITKRSLAIDKWTYLLVAVGNNDLAEGNINDALEKYFALLRMGRNLTHQPQSIDMLIGIGIQSLSLSRINDFIISGSANELYLSQIEKAVLEIKHDWNSVLTGFIDTEKFRTKNLFGCVFYEINHQGKTRLSHDFSELSRELLKNIIARDFIAGDILVNDKINQVRQKLEIYNSYWWKKYSKIQTILFWFYVPATPDKLGEIIDTSFVKYYEMAKPDFDCSKETQTILVESLFKYKMNFRNLINILAPMKMNTYFRLHSIYLETLAKQRGTLLIIALRRYKNANGYWPEKLEDINNIAPAENFINPTNGDSFVYKRNEDNFTLYSKGKNGIDEGGEFQRRPPLSLGQLTKEPSPDDRIFWPIRQKSRNDEEKGTADGQDPNM